MADQSKRGGRKGINWLAVRTYYIAGHSPAECSTRFGVAKRTVEIKRKEEGWGAEKRANLADALQNLADANVADIERTQLTHIEYADRLLTIAMQGEEDLAVMVPGRSRMEARKLFVEGVQRAVQTAREVRGFRAGDASEHNAENDAPSMPVETIRKSIVQRPADYKAEIA